MSLAIVQTAVMRMDVVFRKLEMIPMQRWGIRLDLAHIIVMTFEWIFSASPFFRHRKA
jgi:hypothetical protein